MGETRAKSFQSQIADQSIFKKYVGINSVSKAAPLFPSQTVVTTSSGNIYCANYNIVRYCKISPDSTGFKTLDVTTTFEIHALHLNASENLLALVGESEVTVVELPTFPYDSESIELPTRSHEIGLGKSKIVKVLWQTVIAKDCSLVVLTDNSVIRSFDLSLSVSIPQQFIDLKTFPEFAQQSATSMTFGSSVNLQGSLTLYVSSNSEVYAFYPFLSPKSRLACSKQGIDYALDETRTVVESIENHFGFHSITDSESSTLASSAISQYEFFLHLRHQFESGIPLQTEHRNLDAFASYNLKRLTHSLANDFEPKLQGPLIESDKAALKDIQSFYANDDVSFLASLSSEIEKVHVKYYAQLKPLIMKFKREFTELAGKSYSKGWTTKPLNKSEGTREKEVYVKPKKGFGFVALSDDEDILDQAQAREESALVRVEIIKDEKEYEHEQLNALTLLEYGIVESKVGSHGSRNDCAIINFLEEGKRFVVKLGTKGFLVDANDFLTEFNESLRSETPRDTLEISRSITYKKVNLRDFSALALAKDPLAVNSQHIIILSNDQENNLRVVELDETKPTSPVKTSLIPRVKNASTPSSSLTSIEVDDESRKESPRWANISGSVLSDIVKPDERSKRIGQTAQDLGNVHAISSAALNTVSLMAPLLLELIFKMTERLDRLHLNVEVLRINQERNPSSSSLCEVDNRVMKIKAKQKELDRKQTEVKEKLSQYILKVKNNQSLPLSKLEKAWFKEINALSASLKHIPEDDSKSETMSQKIEAYRAQVRALKNSLATEASTIQGDSAEDIVKQRELRQLLSGLKMIIKDDAEIVEKLKVKLQGLSVQ